MYENQTQETILKRMLANVSNDVDKREGSVIYDATAPASIEFMLLYQMADWFLKNTFGDTAEREYLMERALERGLSPYPATYSTGKVETTPANIDVPIGTRFSYDDVNFAIIAKTGTGQYIAECETLGSAGNLPAGDLVAIDYVRGLENARFVEIIKPAENEEETEHFRRRYLRSFDSQAYGGNIVDYLEKVNAISGVGGCKVYPVWNGGGSVKIVFQTSEYKVPSNDFVQQVQTLIDPVQNHGEGVGIAPIGHTVTVEACKTESVNISLHVTVSGTASLETLKEPIKNMIDEYFLTLNKGWESTKIDTTANSINKGIVVRIAQLESRIMDMAGVIDVEHTTLNGNEDNLTLDVDALAVRGEVTWD